jgi:hypothetical protein
VREAAVEVEVLEERHREREHGRVEMMRAYAEVLRVDGDVMTVLFDEHGYKELSIALVEQGDLLRVLGPASAPAASGRQRVV